MNKEKILSIKGGEFKEWYNSLDEASKLTYRQVRKEMDENFGNNFENTEVLFVCTCMQTHIDIN